ncbi:MAG TPA: STAS domain-containing protein [Candidatus Acidoferrales bacterium]
MQLEIQLRDAEGVTCLDLTGKILLGEETDALRAQVKKIIEDRKKKVLLNLNGVTYLDSTGVGTVVEAFLSVKKAGGKMALLIPAGPADKVTRVFGPLAEASFRSEQEALASLR